MELLKKAYNASPTIGKVAFWVLGGVLIYGIYMLISGRKPPPLITPSWESEEGYTWNPQALANELFNAMTTGNIWGNTDLPLFGNKAAKTAAWKKLIELPDPQVIAVYNLYNLLDKEMSLTQRIHDEAAEWYGENFGGTNVKQQALNKLGNLGLG